MEAIIVNENSKVYVKNIEKGQNIKNNKLSKETEVLVHFLKFIRETQTVLDISHVRVHY